MVVSPASARSQTPATPSVLLKKIGVQIGAVVENAVHGDSAVAMVSAVVESAAMADAAKGRVALANAARKGDRAARESAAMATAATDCA